MRIAEMREILEHTAIDHVYYRTYDPMVRCVGREYTAHRSAHIALLVAAGKLDWEASVAESMYWSFNSKIEQVWNLENSWAAQMYRRDRSPEQFDNLLALARQRRIGIEANYLNMLTGLCSAEELVQGPVDSVCSGVRLPGWNCGGRSFFGVIDDQIECGYRIAAQE